MKNVSYDDDDIDDGYESPDPEEQEYMEECTSDALNQLRSGDPSVSASRKEVQDALWYYYGDVGKSVGYLRSGFFSFSLFFVAFGGFCFLRLSGRVFFLLLIDYD